MVTLAKRCERCGKPFGVYFIADPRFCHACEQEMAFEAAREAARTRLRKANADPVNHPGHYGGGDNPYEAIKVIEAWALGFCLGNTVKYIARAGKKGDAIEDLEKARWYLDREIARRKGGDA